MNFRKKCEKLTKTRSEKYTFPNRTDLIKQSGTMGEGAGSQQKIGLGGFLSGIGFFDSGKIKSQNIHFAGKEGNPCNIELSFALSQGEIGFFQRKFDIWMMDDRQKVQGKE